MSEDEKKAAQELDAALTPPAVAVNRFYILPGPHGARLAFGELGHDGVYRYHVAVEISPENLLELGDFIQKSVVRQPTGTPTPKPGGGGMH